MIRSFLGSRRWPASVAARLVFGALLWAGTVLPAPAAETAQGYWTKLFAFGDSYSDSGAGYVDCDGPTAIVYAARELGIPFTYATDPDAGDKGLNYAVSGARTDDGQGRRVKDARLGYGMQNQVRDFTTGVKAGRVSFDPAHTLFFIAGGLNDGRLPTATTMENLTEIVRGLHAAGARHFFIAVLPTKIPSFARVGQRLNPALEKLPAALQKEFPDSDIRSSHWGRFFDAVMLDPARHGITNTTDACAGRAIFGQDPTPRGDPSTYYFYHEGHPSTAVHRIVGHQLAREFLDAAPAFDQEVGNQKAEAEATK